MAAGSEDYNGEQDKEDDEPVTNEAYWRLMDLAAEKRKKGETVEQAFARLYADPKLSGSRGHREADAR